jgi:hypothetical protein
MSAEHNRLLGLVKRLSDDYQSFGTVERWADPKQEYPDCSCGCRWARWLDGDLGLDWCVCTNPDSHRCGLLTFEHQGCQQADELEADDDPDNA